MIGKANLLVARQKFLDLTFGESLAVFFSQKENAFRNVLEDISGLPWEEILEAGQKAASF